MSAVIKPGMESASRRVVPFAAAGDRSAARMLCCDAREEIAQLRDRLAERDDALETKRGEIAQAHAAGVTEGRIVAEREASDLAERTLALLREGMDRTAKDLIAMRERMDVLAVMIARTALDKMFGDDPVRAELVGALIRQHLQIVERQLLVRIEVSSADFPERDTLSALAAEIGVEITDLAAVGLPTGACRMQMSVGTVDLGLDQQWGAVRALLEEIIAEGTV